MAGYLGIQNKILFVNLREVMQRVFKCTLQTKQSNVDLFTISLHGIMCMIVYETNNIQIWI